MKRTVLITVLVLGLLLSMSISVYANGPSGSPKQLGDAGWTCFNVPGLGVHCTPPGRTLGEDKVIPVRYFDTTDPNAESAPYLGTEILIHGSIYKGQPCPQENLDQYFTVGPYYACHRR